MQYNKLGLLGVTSLVLACAGTTAVAQDAVAPAGGAQPPAAGQPRRGQGGRAVHLSDLSLDTMTSALKLTDEQKTKVQAILDKRAADYKSLILPPDKQGDSQAVREANSKRLDMANKADADIEAVLTDDQKKILPDFKKDLRVFQQAGLPAGLAAEMKLTDDQKKQIVAQVQQNRQTMQQKMAAAQQAGTQMTGAERAAMMKDNRDKILALLTPAQRDQLEKYNKAHPAPVPGAGGATRPTSGGTAQGDAAGNP